LGNLEEAARLIISACKGLARTNGERGELTLRARRYRAVILRLRGDAEIARQQDEETYRWSVEEYGRAHPDTVAVGLSLAADLHALRLADASIHRAAVELARDCLDQLERKVGGGHPFAHAAR